MDEKKKMYVCYIDYNWELGACPVKFYETLEELKKDHKCWANCGVMEVTMEPRIVKEPERFSQDDE